MEVSNEIKEEIRKTQTDLKNAIRVHQVCYCIKEFLNIALFDAYLYLSLLLIIV